MEIKGPKPVKAYAYRLAVKDFETHAEQYHVQVLSSSSRYRQTLSKHPWSAKSHIWPLNDTTVRSGPNVGIVTRRPILSYDEFVWLHTHNSERFIANLEYQQICQYMEDLVCERGNRSILLASTPGPSAAVHVPASHPPPMHTGIMPVKPSSTRSHIRCTGQTTADDLLKSVLAKTKTLPSEATASPVHAGAYRQFARHRETDESREGRNSTIQQERPANQLVSPHDSYIVYPPGSKMRMTSSSTTQLRGGRNGRSLADTQPTNRYRIPSAVSLDPAIVEAVPYAMPLARTKEVARSPQLYSRSELGLCDANLCVDVGVTGISSHKSDGQSIRKPTLYSPREKGETKRMEGVHSPHYISFGTSNLQRTASSPAPRPPVGTQITHGHVSSVLSSEHRIASSPEAQRTTTMQRVHQRTETSAAQKPMSRYTHGGPHTSRLIQHEDRFAEQSKLEERYYRHPQFQCSPRPEDLPLPRFSLAQLKLVSKMS